MPIKFIESNLLSCGIPITSNGHVHEQLFSFLHAFKNEPSSIPNKKKSASEETLRTTAYHLKFLFDTFEDNGIDPYEATYEDVKDLMDFMHDTSFTGNSIQIYVSSWHAYFDYLTVNNIHHNMKFPESSSFEKERNPEGDFQSHTRGNKNTVKRKKNNTVPDDWITKNATYADSVLTMDEFWQLFKALNEEDSVFGVMAIAMLQTLLRNGGIRQFPKSPNAKNPLWKSYREMKSANIETQELWFRNKGGSDAHCTVTIHTMKFIDELLLNHDFEERRKKLIENYVPSKHCKIPRIAKYPPLWINKHGTPVSSHMLQEAFKTASKKIGKKVIPHDLRHTGATHILMNYEKVTGLEINMSMLSDIHSWLQMQLCHVDLDTTKKYIKTVLKLRGNAAILALLPGTFDINKTDVGIDVKKAFEQHMEHHINQFTEIRSA